MNELNFIFQQSFLLYAYSGDNNEYSSLKTKAKTKATSFHGLQYICRIQRTPSLKH